ncbi:MAG: glycogen synthase [Methanosarcinaceae archaeon]|nr:glycogen synthase [Methanosarcinaceae archaeon]MDF1534215.1 glycogen synthase [Methanosarcinaceae archaeon]
MGGIWNVIDAEAMTLASLFNSGAISDGDNPRILVAGPYYGSSGSDWNKGLNRITDMSEFDEFDLDGELAAAIEAVRIEGIEIIPGVRKVGETKIGFLMFKTDNFGKIITDYKGTSVSLTNKIKSEAYELINLDSLKYDNLGNGSEYTHYLNLSYAISEFVRALVTLNEEKAREYHDTAITDFAKSLMPNMQVSLHCHEFGVFYAIARLEKMGIPVKSVATFHATLPGRCAGHLSIQKIRNNDSSWVEGVPLAFAKLESLSSYADVVTAVGNSTSKETKLFYGVDSILVRNGVTLDDGETDWDKKTQFRKNIQNFLSENLHKYHDGEQIPYKKIIPLFSISRIEIENKGYPDLLDSLVMLDRMVKMEILGGKLDEDVRIVCFIIAAHGPKSNLPDGFPINLPKEVLVGDELRLQSMIEERGLECSKIPSGKRCVSAVLYPQWISSTDGGLNITLEELMSGCVAGIFPSRYDPFLLTGLEAGKESTPSIVSKVCGFSDALKTLKRLVMGMGGVIVVDNIDMSYNETIVDYALAMDYFIDTYFHDKVKYNLLCEEANLLAKEMNWDMPAKHYYELLTGIKVT